MVDIFNGTTAYAFHIQPIENTVYDRFITIPKNYKLYCLAIHIRSNLSHNPDIGIHGKEKTASRPIFEIAAPDMHSDSHLCSLFNLFMKSFHF